MKEQLIEAWRISNSMMLVFIENVNDEAMLCTLSSRGRNVFQQFVHVHNVRLTWLNVSAKEIAEKYKHLDKDIKVDRKVLKNAFEQSGKAIEELIDKSWDNGGKVKGFKKGLIPMIGYFIAHDAHHRGHALLTIKQSGIKIPEELKWKIWEWEK